MKNVFFKRLAIVAIAATMSMAAKGQNNFGAQAGVNFSTFSGIVKSLLDSDIDVSRKPGIQFGVFAESPFGSSDFGLQGELFFAQLGGKLEHNYTYRYSEVREVGTLNLNCLMLRSHVQYKYAFTHDFALTVHTGLHIGYALWAKSKYEMFEEGKKVDGNSDSFFGDANGKAADLGVGLGVAGTIQDRFRVGMDYDAGILFSNLSFSFTYIFGN